MQPLKLLVQCSIAEMGVDLPFLQVDIDLRLTRSLPSWIQRRGRVSRSYPTITGDRAYQTRIMDQCRAELAANRNPLVVSPCGSGKGEMEVMIAQACHAKGRSVAIVTPRRLLVSELSSRLTKRNVPHSVCMAGYKDTGERVKVVSIDTAAARNLQFDVSLLMVDECHTFGTQDRLAFIESHARIPRISWTATPQRGDGIGLKCLADSIVMGPTIQELTALGFLVPPTVFSVPQIDTSSIAMSGDDFNQESAAAFMNKPKHIANAIKEYRRLADGLPGIVHCSNTLHAKSVCDRFNAEGIPAAVLTSKSTDDERRDVFERLWMSAVPKTRSLLLDCASNVLHMGFPDDDREWTLEDQEGVSRQPHNNALSIRHCKNCLFAFKSAIDSCPNCGAKHVPTQKRIIERDLEMAEMKRIKREGAIKKAQARMSEEDKFAKLKGIVADGRAKGWKPAAALIKYKLSVGEPVPSKWMSIVFGRV